MRGKHLQFNNLNANKQKGDENKIKYINLLV